MSLDVKLVYDPTCPHVSAARRALLQAFAIAGRPARWTEWRTDSPEIPEQLRGLGSPTILVAGQDVVATATEPTGPSCRLYGDAASAAPSPSEIAKRIGTRSWISIGGVASGASGFAALMLPVGLCPTCWPVYAAVLASLGAGFLLETTYQAPIAAGLFAFALAAHWFQARRTGRYAALLLALAGATVALAGKFILVVPAAQYAGVFAFVLSGVWAAVSGRRQMTTNNRHFFSNQALEDVMSVKRKVEVFTAGCPACEEALELINRVACSSCEVEVYDMHKPEAAAKAKTYGIHRVPSVVVNGTLLDCCAAGPIDEAALREAGVGQG